MSLKSKSCSLRAQINCFAVVRCMAEAKCFIMGHKYPTMLYTDHLALESIMGVGTEAHGRIARWMDRLTEYDYIVHHRTSKTNIIFRLL